MSQEKLLRKEEVVSVPLGEVWKAWTTSEGLMTFLAPKANVQPVIGGPYELYFDLNSPLGFQGTEGCKVLALDSSRAVAFDFLAPPRFPNVRRLRSRVDLQFEEVQRGGVVKVSLIHSGFLEGEEWDEYFEFSSWSWDLAMRRLQYRFTSGPLSWDDPYTPPELRSVPELRIRDRAPPKA